MVQNNNVDERAGQKVYYTHTEAKKKGTTRKLKEYWVAERLESLETVGLYQNPVECNYN